MQPMSIKPPEKWALKATLPFYLHQLAENNKHTRAPLDVRKQAWEL